MEKRKGRKKTTKTFHQTKRDGCASVGNPTEGGDGGVKGRLGWGRGSGRAQLHTTAHWLGMHEVS